MMLVTGGTGFLGQRLVRKLVELGCKHIRCLVRPGTPVDVLAPALADLPSADVGIFPASFNDESALHQALKDVDIVYHAAASKMGTVPAMVANTVVGSDRLYRISVAMGIARFVLVSSFGVIDVARLSRGTVVDESIPMDEHPEWRDPYSFSKHRQEALAWQYARCQGLPLVVIRPGVIFGPGNDILGVRIGLRFGNFFAHLGGPNKVPLTYVDNCAEAIALAGTVPGVVGEVFCIVDDHVPTSRTLLRRYLREVASLHVMRLPYRLLRSLSKWNVWYANKTQGHLPVAFTPYQVDAMWKGHHFSNQKAKELLGWTPRISMQEALNITYASLARVQATNQ